MSYIPCFGLSPWILQNAILKNKTTNIIKSSIALDENETMRIKIKMKNFDFVKNEYFLFESENLFVTVFYRSSDHCEYIIIYY